MQRNHVTVALLKRGGGTRAHRKTNKAKRMSEKQALKKSID